MYLEILNVCSCQVKNIFYCELWAFQSDELCQEGQFYKPEQQCWDFLSVHPELKLSDLSLMFILTRWHNDGDEEILFMIMFNILTFSV